MDVSFGGNFWVVEYDPDVISMIYCHLNLESVISCLSLKVCNRYQYNLIENLAFGKGRADSIMKQIQPIQDQRPL